MPFRPSVEADSRQGSVHRGRDREGVPGVRRRALGTPFMTPPAAEVTLDDGPDRIDRSLARRAGLA
jgi:hypothetical protein